MAAVRAGLRENRACAVALVFESGFKVVVWERNIKASLLKTLNQVITWYVTINCRNVFCRNKAYSKYFSFQVFQFLNAKCESAFLSKRNPRQINWTVLYRRKHKKGQSEEIQKKRTRRAVKFQRAITGASLAEIMAKRNQKPEVRKAQREQAIRAAKEAKKAKQATKKTAVSAAKAPTKAAPKQKIVKPVKVSAPRVGGKR
nr:60S ribosomal protein L24 [Columba livia]